MAAAAQAALDMEIKMMVRIIMARCLLCRAHDRNQSSSFFFELQRQFAARWSSF
jgi:hypothetical protein